MSNIQNVAITIEKHSLRGLLVKLYHNNKILSPYSSTTPREFRPLLRNVLTYKKIEEDLIEILTTYSHKIDLFVVLKGERYSSVWNKTVLEDNSLKLQLIENSVHIHQTLKDDDCIFMSDKLCFFKSTNMLCPINISSNSLDQVPWIKNKLIHKKNNLNTLDNLGIEDFNGLGLFVESINDIKSLAFFNRKTLQNVKEIIEPLICNINFSSDSSIVYMSLFYEHNNEKIYPLNELLLKISDEFAEQDLSARDKKRLSFWFLNVLNKNAKRKHRLVYHFLPKLCSPILTNLITTLFTIEKEALLHLTASKTDWLLINLNYTERVVFLSMITLLFDYSIVDNNNVPHISVEKREFNQYFAVLKNIMDVCNIQINYSDKKIEIIDHNFEVDLTGLDTQEHNPTFYLNNKLITFEQILALKNNMWTSVFDDHVTIYDNKLMDQCNKLLVVKTMQEKSKSNKKMINFQQHIHLLDWLALKQSGISIRLSPEQEKVIESFMSFKKLNTVKLPESMKKLSRKYQQDGLNWLSFLYNHKLGGVLADDMGLGKTFQTILLLASLKEKNIKKSSKPHLIVVPSSLVFNWAQEFERFFPALKISLYIGNNRDLSENSDVIITSYELLRRDLELFLTIHFDVLIFDEAQFIKNPNSARSQAARSVKRNACFCLTGTPMENHIGEYITILNLTLPGFLNDPQQVMGSSMPTDIMNFIVRRSKPFILRRLKSQISHELKEKTEDSIILKMTDSQQKMYDGILTAAKKQFNDKENNLKIKFLMLTVLLRLRQVCISPYLIDDNYTELSPKFSFLKEKLLTLKDEGHSALVFTQFMKSLDLLESLCKENNINYFRLDGTLSAVKRNKVIQEFQSFSGPAVFLMSLKASGFGLNLVKASYVFHVDPWWNPAVENQATDRVHRIGQTRNVFSYKLVMHNSIERKIEEIKSKKSKLFKELLDDSDISQRKSTLTVDDFKELLF